MVDIQTVSIVIASASVVAGVVYYAFQIRHQSKMRQTDLLVRICSVYHSKDWQEAWDKVDSLETDELIKMRREHRMAEISQVYMFFDEIGVLLQMGLIDINLVEKLLSGHAIRVWEKLKPLIDYRRKLRNDPRIAQGFEYLYNEMKKREQRQ
jgi:hypothetical protein